MMSGAVSQERTGRMAAIYARVSSERQPEEGTIESQVAGLRELAAGRGLIVDEEFVFCDEGISGATLTRPALERLRDRAAEGGFEVLLCHAPDRLARRYAYQVLLLEELARAGVEVVFARGGERSGSPEDELLRQFQGMIAEYERAQIRERTRRGKLHRARTGSQAVMAGAPTATGSCARPSTARATGSSTRAPGRPYAGRRSALARSTPDASIARRHEPATRYTVLAAGWSSLACCQSLRRGASPVRAAWVRIASAIAWRSQRDGGPFPRSRAGRRPAASIAARSDAKRAATVLALGHRPGSER
jgi:predicted site-specific integrase-resolvase